VESASNHVIFIQSTFCSRFRAIGRPVPRCVVTEGQAGHVRCDGGLSGSKSKKTDNVLARPQQAVERSHKSDRELREKKFYAPGTTGILCQPQHGYNKVVFGSGTLENEMSSL
jgi:hypothetical protein